MAESIQEEIKKHYGGIAKRVSVSAKSSCCGGGDCCGDVTSESDLYSAEYI